MSADVCGYVFVVVSVCGLEDMCMLGKVYVALFGVVCEVMCAGVCGACVNVCVYVCVCVGGFVVVCVLCLWVCALFAC